MATGKAMRWGAVTLGAVAGITIIATTAMPRGPQAPEEITVVLSDAASGKGDACSAEDYAGGFFDGATVTVTDETDAEIASGEVDGAGEPGQRGCTWTVRFEDVPRAESYTVTVDSGGGRVREHEYTYTAAELADRDGDLWIGVIA